MKNLFASFTETFTSRNPLKKKVASNTYLTREKVGDVISLRFYNTDIIRAFPDGYIVLNSGGFKTVTTKARLNEFLSGTGVSIYQGGGLWYYSGGRPFADGDKLTLTPEGYKVDGPAPDEKDVKKLRRQILSYSKEFAAALPVEQPGGGDCWYCAMRGESKEREPRMGFKTAGTIPLGDMTGNTEHLTSHMAENYFVPALAYNAAKEFGVSDMVLAGAFKGTGAGDYVLKLSRDYVGKAIRRYLYRRFGLPG